MNQFGKEADGHEGAKPQRAIYLRNDLIFTTGFSKMSERQYSLRSEAGLDPIVLETLDTSNGVLYPFYDPDVNLLYLVAKVSFSHKFSQDAFDVIMTLTKYFNLEFDRKKLT